MIERMAMSDEDAKKRRVQSLLFAMVCEAGCIGAGVIGYVLVHKVIWIVIGVVAGLGFMVPAVIKFVRETKEHDRASR